MQRRKNAFTYIWDIASPMVLLYLAELGAAVAVMGIAGFVTGTGSLNADALLTACPQVPLVSSICGYALALAVIRPLVRYDEPVPALAPSLSVMRFCLETGTELVINLYVSCPDHLTGEG